jgi:meiotically up-regulated gene 157 (Mug157) protein
MPEIDALPDAAIERNTGLTKSLPTRRTFLASAAALAAMQTGALKALDAQAADSSGVSAASTGDLDLPHARPALADRKFTSPSVEDAIATLQKRIADPALRVLLENCLPNTLDTTVYPGTFDGHSDTFVVTGDIDAMWLRDSSAQVWPYLRFARQDAKLRVLLEGVVRRQARMIQLDPYANAFTRDPADPPLPWAVHDNTEHHAGVAERKWEIDSLCYTIRLAHGYWQATGDTGPFDAQWKAAAEAILRTFTEQQRKQSPGPYSFRREAASPYDTLALSGFGNPTRPNGMIFSMFRPSDDACIYPLFVPANLFAVRALRQLAELALHAAQDTALAARASALADEVAKATAQHGRVNHPRFGEIWAYEVDGYGNSLLMDDANAPGLASLAYLGACDVGDPVYQRSRAFAYSGDNPYFFRGTAAEGVGGPHIGLNAVWPMSIMFRAFTSTSEAEIRQCLRWLRYTTAGTGFMHESFDKDNPAHFTRTWFAWANTLFGELLLTIADQRPRLLAEPLA